MKIPVTEEKPKHPGGRPSEYDDGILLVAKSYLENLPTDEIVPTVQGLAAFIGITSRTVYRWCEEHEEFCHTVEALKDKQAILLQNKGLRKETDSGITKLMLSANHGMAEKSESKQEQTGEMKIRILKD